RRSLPRPSPSPPRFLRSGTCCLLSSPLCFPKRLSCFRLIRRSGFRRNLHFLFPPVRCRLYFYLSCPSETNSAHFRLLKRASDRSLSAAPSLPKPPQFLLPAHLQIRSLLLQARCGILQQSLHLRLLYSGFLLRRSGLAEYLCSVSDEAHS